ncbi:hypothetical protein EMIHUDRAFT_235917 [Emiliania huxleyi CCMP1516]|uniref:Acyltransferase 3 domain-containing protein n=2 Tax=Emiliania huxleyi TaxID=2903 RepID=A0A0D3JUZ8_EMIH1|nr:hypothetical protein EMIHUDRAFT_235917 [Emiliania huxleyi CCMP1516]EOD27333.1 hypothetical protein EMIHUDRAFT_235917 [Emiliania huxleyi CCMP1516]|eukprot:XP_005779762.1 hypothetical protein EMIHUDRAFT_235917 [Emiliania huxleyi CCMP1516]
MQTQKVPVRRKLLEHGFIILSGFITMYAYREKRYTDRASILRFYCLRFGAIVASYYLFYVLNALYYSVTRWERHDEFLAGGAITSLFLVQAFAPASLCLMHGPIVSMAMIDLGKQTGCLIVGDVDKCNAGDDQRWWNWYILYRFPLALRYAWQHETRWGRIGRYFWGAVADITAAAFFVLNFFWFGRDGWKPTGYGRVVAYEPLWLTLMGDLGFQVYMCHYLVMNLLIDFHAPWA